MKTTILLDTTKGEANLQFLVNGLLGLVSGWYPRASHFYWSYCTEELCPCKSGVQLCCMFLDLESVCGKQVLIRWLIFACVN